MTTWSLQRSSSSFCFFEISGKIIPVGIPKLFCKHLKRSHICSTHFESTSFALLRRSRHRKGEMPIHEKHYTISSTSAGSIVKRTPFLVESTKPVCPPAPSLENRNSTTCSTKTFRNKVTKKKFQYISCSAVSFWNIENIKGVLWTVGEESLSSRTEYVINRRKLSEVNPLNILGENTFSSPKGLLFFQIEKREDTRFFLHKKTTFVYLTMKNLTKETSLMRLSQKLLCSSQRRFSSEKNVARREEKQKKRETSKNFIKIMNEKDFLKDFHFSKKA